jgi:hypothetical protein
VNALGAHLLDENDCESYTSPTYLARLKGDADLAASQCLDVLLEFVRRK